MPYKLKQSGKGYFVVNVATGLAHSKEPMTLKNAKAQLRILQAVAKNEKQSTNATRLVMPVKKKRKHM